MKTNALSRKMTGCNGADMKMILTTAVVSLFIFLMAGSLAHAAEYSVTRLGPVGEGYLDACTINNQGQVVGKSEFKKNKPHAFLYENGLVTDLGTLGGNRSHAFDINEKGQIAGWAGEKGQGKTYPFIYDPAGGGMVRIEGAEGKFSSGAASINDAGQVVGWVDADTKFAYSFFYDPVAVPSIVTIDGSSAASINNRGLFVGEIETEEGKLNAFIHEEGSLTRINPSWAESSGAVDINDAGQVIGWAKTGNNRITGFIYDNEAFVEISLPMDEETEIYLRDINERGQVVLSTVSDAKSGSAYNSGDSGDDDENRRAFIYENETLRDLNDLIEKDSGWELKEAFSINDKGEIVCFGYLAGEGYGAVLLTPGDFPSDPDPSDPEQPTPATPVADAGENQVVVGDITLDGSGSFDPDGGELNFKWSATHRQSKKEIGAIGKKPTLSGLVKGFYDVVLTVKSESGEFDDDMMVFEIAEPTLSVEPRELRLTEGETGKITIINGTSPHDLSFGDHSIASAVSKGKIVTLKGLAKGATLLTITDDTGDSVSVSVTVVDDGIDMLRIEEFGEGFTFDYDERYDAGNGTLVFQVKDQNGFPVNGLTLENFEFIQDKIPADIESFSDLTSDRILNVSMVLDASFSMSVDDAHIKLKEAAGALVDRLGDNADFKYYRFANRVREIGGVDEIELDEMDRFSSMYDAVYQAIDDANHEVEQRIIVLFTDGADNHSLRSLSEVTSLIGNQNVVIYSIALGDVVRQDLEAMSVNGAVVMAEDAGALDNTFDIIGSYLKSIYTVTYWTPSRRGIHELGFRVHKGGLYSNTIQTLFEADVDRFHAVPNGIRSPKFSVKRQGNRVDVSWEDVDNADGYTFYYAPPDISFVRSVDAGRANAFSVELWGGFTYYLAVQPYNAAGDIGGLSNIELLEIP